MPDPIIFPAEVLLPPQWLCTQPSDRFAAYNPAIVRFDGRLLMAYRVDSSRRGAMRRRIGLCQLDEPWQIIPGSVSPLSDTIHNGGDLHYDPRFLVYRDRLFIHYNNNFQTRPNRIFLVELDPDTLATKAPARPLALDGPRRDIEKNWMLFEHEGELLAVYTIAPHVILRAELTGTGPVVCHPVYQTDWAVSAYTALWGEPCGGAPPVRHDEVYVSFFHSRYPVSRVRWVLRYWPVPPGAKLPRYLAAIERRLRRPFNQVRYVGGVYAFEAAPPFRPVWLLPEPVLRPENEQPRQQRRRANPSASGIVYPCGAVQWDDESWLVSYGVHDERCVLQLIPQSNLMKGSLRF